jgi:HK97 family phage major capsid protein
MSVSEMAKIKSLLEEKNNIWESKYKEEVDKINELGHKNSEALNQMDERLDQIMDSQGKLEKSLKQQASMRQVKDGMTEESVKELTGYFIDLKKLGRGEISQIDTNEMKSNVEFKAQFNERDDSAGGLFIPPTIDSMIGTLQREFSNLRGIASTATIAGDVWKQNLQNQTNGAVRRKDLANFNDPTKKDTFGSVTIMVSDLFSFLDFTDNLEMDSAVNIVSQLLSKAAEDFTITESAEFINGDGVEEMKGVLTYADGTGFDKVERTQSGTTLVLGWDDIFNVIYSLKSGYRTGSTMFANRLTQRVIRKLQDNEGRYLWEFSQQAGQPAMVAGFPIMEMPELVAPDASDNYVQGDEPIIFGNLNRGYKIVDRLGITTQRDEFTDYPNIRYKMKKRSGGGVILGEAIKTLQIS